MKKEGILVLIAIFLISILLFSNFASAYSFVGRAVDDVQISLSRGDKKVEVALEAREKEIDAAIANIKEGNTKEAIKNLERAKEKLELIQEQASSEIADEVKQSTEEITKKLMENKDLDPEFKTYLEGHLTEEQKTQLSAELSERLFSYCEELAKQDYELMLADEKCSKENAPSWLKDQVDDGIDELEEESAKKMLEIFTTCISDPRACDCSEIPIASEQAKCEQGKALSIRCEFQNDESACKELDKMDIEVPSNIPKFLQPLFRKRINDAINNKEKEMFEKFAPPECVEAGAKTREECESVMMQKYAPRECVEAGATTKEECEKIMIGIHGPPPSECMENGEFIGPEACEQKMVKSGMIPDECIKNGKPLPKEECEAIMKEKGTPGNIPQECIKDGKPIPEQECIAIMQEKGIMMGPPPECEGLSKEECGKIMQEKGILQGGDMLSGECRELGITDFYECQEIVNLPRPCKDAGIYTIEECEGKLMQQHMPQECVDAGALTPDACRQITLPPECKTMGAGSWEECETVRIVNQMPMECQEQGADSPEECAGVMTKNMVVGSPGSETEFLNKRGVAFDDIPSVCKSGSNFVRGMDCDKALSEMGIVLPPPKDVSNIPGECMQDGVPVSPQECQTILETKLVDENIPGPCREAGITSPEDCGRFLNKERTEQGLGMNMPEECLGLAADECRKIMKEKGMEIKQGEIGEGVPKECTEMGVDDATTCDMVMSKINEERIKSGEKMIVDSQGNQDYITPGEIEIIVKEAEQRSEQTVEQREFNLATAEQYRQEVEYYEEQIEKVDRGEMMVKADMMEKREFVEGPEFAPGPEGPSSGGGGGGESSSSDGGESGGGGDEVSSGGGESGGASGGGSESSGGEELAPAE